MSGLQPDKQLSNHGRPESQGHKMTPANSVLTSDLNENGRDDENDVRDHVRRHARAVDSRVLAAQNRPNGNVEKHSQRLELVAIRTRQTGASSVSRGGRCCSICYR